MTAPLTLSLDDVAEDMLGLAGGKAVNLGVLLRAGFPVPAGCCVTTEAYRRVTAATGLPEIVAKLDDLGAGDPRALAELAARARELIGAASVPADIADAIKAAAAPHVAAGPVAVRSSATAEDLPHASFAGQQDTYLDVTGLDATLDAVRRCWASLWTDRAVAYRAAHGVSHDAVRLAVVVQRMVPAEVAGVLFTADPVTGRRRQAVIDAAPGLGEAVVSGSVDPDRFVVAPDGHITTTLPPGRREPCLTADQVARLAALGRRVEDHYGAPQDTEWALDTAGEFWLTQARPVTTLYPVPQSALAASGGPRVYLCFSLAQGLHRPITPMGVAALRLLSASLAAVAGRPVPDPRAGAPVFAVAGERVYLDFTAAVRSDVGRAIIPKGLDFMEARSAAVLRSLGAQPELSVVSRSRRPFLRVMARIARRHRVPVRLLRALIVPETEVRRARGRLDGLRSRLDPPGTPTAADRLDHVERVLSGQVAPLLVETLPVAAAGFLGLGLAAWLLGDRARRGELSDVLRGLPDNVTTEMDLALWDLATRVRADPESARLIAGTPPADIARRVGTLPPVLEEGLAEFLAAYGGRAVAEIDLGVPRWSDDPEHIIGVLANYLRLDDPDLAPDAQFRRGAAAAEATIAELAGRVGPLRRPLVRFGLRRARRLAGLRELPKFLVITAFAAMRRQLAAVGAELAAAGRIGDPADVFFLDLYDARAGLGGADLRELVAERRAAYEREMRRRHVPRVLLSDGTEPEAVAGMVAGAAAGTVAEGALTGTPASSGVVTGTARVVLDPVGARLEPGEILVAPSTDPGWTPLFLTAGGLVMEMGGANSHGAVVAREYGIPAVVGVHGATERIEPGSRITVDGTAGSIVIEPDGEPTGA